MAKKKRAWICRECRRKNEPNKRKCVYCKSLKSKTVRQLIKELDTWFSRFVRDRDRYICVTCGRPGNEAGHYIKRGVMSLRWDEVNVHCQCTRCNKYLSGNLDQYALYLTRKHGPYILEQLEAIAQKKVKPDRLWMEMKIEHYKKAMGHF